MHKKQLFCFLNSIVLLILGTICLAITAVFLFESEEAITYELILLLILALGLLALGIYMYYRQNYYKKRFDELKENFLKYPELVTQE